MTATGISIIIPTLNEAKNIAGLLGSLKGLPGIEIIVADGGSVDETLMLAESDGVRVIRTAPGRSRQMNAGAEAATGNILLFLHVDCRLPNGFSHQIQELLSRPGVKAGAFRLAIDGPGLSYRIIEAAVNLRSILFRMPYGDQALFFIRETFQELGGFPDLPIMEDFALVRKIRKKYRLAIAPASVITSARRWEKWGIAKTTLLNQTLILGYVFGVNPEKLNEWYRMDKEDNV